MTEHTGQPSTGGRKYRATRLLTLIALWLNSRGGIDHCGKTNQSMAATRRLLRCQPSTHPTRQAFTLHAFTLRGNHPMRYRLTAAVAVLTLSIAGCSGASSDAGTDDKPAAGSKGTVKIAVNPWVGYEANAAVVGYLLQHELGYTVEKKNLKEEISWQGFETGEVDVVLENWGHDDLKKTYVQEKKTAVELGPTGNKGVIGWYVPQWMADKY